MLYLTQAEGIITGTMVKMSAVAGPVIVSGTVASALYGLMPVLPGCGHKIKGEVPRNLPLAVKQENHSV